MELTRAVELVGAALVVCLVGALVLGQVLGQPILFGYVTTGSMEPTLDPGDGFVAIPASLAGPIEEGDVVTFRAEELHGGGLVTHRVVEKTDRGYVTKGDANPFTDQDGPEPYVKRPQIVAVAWQVGGTVVVLPNLGDAAEGVRAALAGTQRWLAVTLGTRSLLGTQGLAYLLFAVSTLAYLVDVLRGTEEAKDRTRETKKDDGYSGRLIILGLTVLVVSATTAGMLVPTTQHKLPVVSADSDSPGARVIETGTSESMTFTLPNGAVLPVHVFLVPQTEGVTVDRVDRTIPARGSVNATVTLTAPPETGYYRQFVAERRYIAVLPRSTVAALHDVHPLLPVAVVDGVLGLPFYLLGVTLVGHGRFKVRRKTGPSGGWLS